MKAERVGRKIAGVAIEQPESGNVLHDLAILARQQNEIVRFQQQGMADVDREGAVRHDVSYMSGPGGPVPAASVGIAIAAWAAA